MKNLLARVARTLPLGLSRLASAQGGTMMDGGMGGSGWMGGYWGPVLLVVVVGLVAWIVMRGRK
jgi:hypothetical protein